MNLNGEDYGVKHLLVQKEDFLEPLLLSELGLNPELTRFLLNLGAIYLNKERAHTFSAPENRQSLLLKPGDYVRVHTQPRRFPSHQFDWKSLVKYENEDLVVIDKPSKIPIHPTVDNTQENALAEISKLYGQVMHVTHRLDVPTSGLVVIAKNKLAQQKFFQLLKLSEVKKTYEAISQGHYQGPDHLVHYMKPSPKAPKELHHLPQETWQKCELEIQKKIHLDQTSSSSHQNSKHQVLTNPASTYLEINLLTGRTHQIRTQLAYQGFPIIGDVMYGGPKLGPDEIALRACRIQFEWEGHQIDIKDYKILQNVMM